MGIWKEIKKAINSDFLNEPLDAKINVNNTFVKKVKQEFSTTPTLDTYVTLLDYAGKGRLTGMNIEFTNAINTTRDVILKITLDGNVVAWTHLDYAGGSTNTILVGLCTTDVIVTNTSNDNPKVLMPTQYQINSVPIYLDGSPYASLSTGTTLNTYFFDSHCLYFTTSLKVELYVNAGSGAGDTVGFIEYYTNI